MKKFKVIGCIVVLFALASANVWSAKTNTKSLGLNVADVEYIAEGDTDYYDSQRKKKANNEYDCHVTKTVTFNASGKYQLPDGSYIEGQANTTRTVEYTYTADKCKGGQGECVVIRCNH